MNRYSYEGNTHMIFSKDSFSVKSNLKIDGNDITYFSLNKLADNGFPEIDKLPFSIKILLENLLRNEDGKLITVDHIENMARWNTNILNKNAIETPFMPARILLQDFTGVPSVVDMAGMRDAAKRLNIDPAKINPQIPVELIIDHSVQIDSFGSETSLEHNTEKEFERNFERYTFLRWGQKNFKNFSVTPPGTGIIHQVNLEYLAKVVFAKKDNGQTIAFPDTLVGLDSHTTMVNGIGALGWGVGGIEAEAVMLGSPYYMLIPQVIGCKLTGKLPNNATATDLILTLTKLLREKGVVGKFVEFYGDGVAELSAENRATIANMAPEYGATMGFFPVDDETIKYLRLTGRPESDVALVEIYCKQQGLFKTKTTNPVFTDTIEFDMSSVELCVAGPKRPYEHIPLSQVKQGFVNQFQITNNRQKTKVNLNDKTFELCDGSIVIAAIASCTNTSNPSVLVGAGLLAKKAVECGLSIKPWVKTSFSPGSKVVKDYLETAGLLAFLETLNFHIVAYGCASCIGNSGPLSEPVSDAIKNHNLIVASVISGNRNFEGRISPLTKANFLVSPSLVVAYAIAGRIDIDFDKEPLAMDANGNPVYLREILPSAEEIKKIVENVVRPEMYRKQYATAFEGSNRWRSLPTVEGSIYNWDLKSTYIKEPPFFKNITPEIPKLSDIRNARVLALLGDMVTTDHISPAGAIPIDSSAGAYLISQGIEPSQFNSFGSRRGNHEVMMRGAFGNIRLQNKLTPNISGGWSIFLPDGEKLPIYDVAMRYQKNNVPLVVMAGKEYGAGSSRDWAAKGTYLLGIKAVIAESFERIHRSNLVCMGVLPLEFINGENYASLKLDGTELYDITEIEKDFAPKKQLSVCAHKKNGESVNFNVLARIDSPIELTYYKHGGILTYILRNLK